MKTRLLIFATLLALLIACHKDDGPTDIPKSDAKQITSFVFKAADNSMLGADVTASIDENVKTVLAILPNSTDVTALVPTIAVSPKASVSPTGATDFIDTVPFTVTAEDGTSVAYQATVTVENSSANLPPESFALLQVANDSINVVPAPTFSWETATDPDGDTVSYDLYLDRQADPTVKVAEGLSDSNFTLPDVMALSLARDYHWKVVAKDGKGGETASEVFGFKVQHLNDAQQLNISGPFNPVSNHASVVFEGAMYVLGGFANFNFSDDTWASTDGEQWAVAVLQASEKFTGRFFHAAAVFNDTVYIAGGSVNGNFSNDVWQRQNGGEWTEINQLDPFIIRQEHTLTEHDGKMWVIGGSNGDGKLADVWGSADGASWSQAVQTADFGKRNFHQTVSFKDKLWVIGGIDEDENGGANFKNDVWSSSDGTIWQLETEHAQFSPRGFHKALVFDDKIWIVGGGGANAAVNDIWYSEDGVEWIDATPTDSFPPKDGFTALFHNNKIWILGGNDTNEVWSIAYHLFTN